MKSERQVYQAQGALFMGSGFGARVAKRCIFGRSLGGDPELFIAPGTQIDVAAALATERPELVGRHKNAGATAGGAFHHGGGLVVSAHGAGVSQLEKTGGLTLKAIEPQSAAQRT